METAVDNAVFEWEEGHSRVEAARSDPGRYRLLLRLVAAVQAELRKQLGSRFTVPELARHYRARSDSLVDVAMAAAPPGEGTADASAACDAAFYLYMREAADFGGGHARKPG